MCMESKEMRDAKNVAKAKQKENKKDDKEEDSSFKKELYQKILVNGTLQGLEDVLAAKYDEGVTPGVLFACDELSVLFSNLEKDATFDSTFLMLYTAKVIYIFFPHQFKRLQIDIHLKWLNIQREGFTNLGEIIVGWYSFFFIDKLCCIKMLCLSMLDLLLCIILIFWIFQFLRTNTRSYGLLDIVNPRVNITGYTQPETILKFMVKSEEDSGGKWER